MQTAAYIVVALWVCFLVACFIGAFIELGGEPDDIETPNHEL